MANEHRTTEVMRVCTERVYSDNPFHLLGLRTTATPRQIRRRHEDLDAAREMGDAAWRAEFGYLLGTREVPTSEEVEEAFARLGDAESRLLAEFFWMWPMQGQDVTIEALVAGEKTVAFDLWERAALGFGRARLAARHNLAVVYHLYAIDAEVQAIAAAEPIPEDFSRTMLSYWDQAFRHWEALADDDAFWELFEARMRAFDDPRLTGGFVRRLRRDFPVAFDNINARLAVRYAEAGRFDEARRHIDAMRRTMSGLDDVAQNLSLIFAPVEKRLSMLTAQYEARIAEDPLDGKACFQELLSHANAFTRLATGLLDKEDPIRLRILSTIFNAANSYLTAYCNRTFDWNDCLALNERLAPFVCTDELWGRYNKNTEIIKGNARRDRYNDVEKHLAVFAKECFARIKANPESGAVCFMEVMNASNWMLAALDGLFDETDGPRIRLRKDFFNLANCCLTAYGNSTKRWEECARLNELLARLACTKALREICAKNREMLQENARVYNEKHTCQICKRITAQDLVKVAIPFHKDVKARWNSFSYNRFEVPVWCCQDCEAKLEAYRLQEERFGSPKKYAYDCTVNDWRQYNAQYAKMFTYEEAMEGKRLVNDCPACKKAFSEGWVFGRDPTDWECNEAVDKSNLRWFAYLFGAVVIALIVMCISSCIYESIKSGV